MVEKILDNYYRKKLAKEFINGAKMTFHLNFYYVEYKTKIEIYANYVEKQNALLNPKKIYTINNDNIIYILANFNESFKEFKTRVDEIMK